MRLWKRMKKTAAAAVQTARGRPAADTVQPPHWREWAVYDGLRQSIPVIDAAIGKIGRLVGGCAPICTDQRAQPSWRLFSEMCVSGPPHAAWMRLSGLIWTAC